MKYMIFKTKFQFKQYQNQLQLTNEDFLQNKFSENISDNYDKHRDYGFYLEDDRKAVCHLMRMRRILHDPNKKAMDRTEAIKSILLKDFRNYLSCCLNMLDKKKIVGSLIEILAADDLERELLEIIQEYYDEKYALGKEEEYWSADEVLDFANLYIKIGDRALFLKQDLELAMNYYRLATLDWYHMYEHPERESEVQNEYVKHWPKTYLGYEQIVSGRLISRDVYVESMKEKECDKLFSELAVLWAEEGSHEEIVEKSDQFMDAFAIFINTKLFVEEIRQSVIEAYVVRAKSIKSGLICLSKETRTIQNELGNSVLDCIRQDTSKDIEIFRRYLRNRKNSAATFQQILLFAETINIVSAIKQLLCVRNLTQDMAYYTSLETFSYMLPKHAKNDDECGHLSIMNIAYMNDPNEGKVLPWIIFETDGLPENKGRKSVKYPYVFLKCFTSLVDDLPMWEMYGNHAEGCCLILDWKESLGEREGNTVPLFRVCYVTKNKKENVFQINQNFNRGIKEIKNIEKYVDELKKIAGWLPDDPDEKQIFMQLLESITYLFKDSSYSHEREMRIIYNYQSYSDDFKYTTGEYPFLYVQPDFPIKLKEIIVGPKFRNISGKMPYFQEQIEKMCDKIGVEYPKITVSAIDYQ